MHGRMAMWLVLGALGCGTETSPQGPESAPDGGRRDGKTSDGAVERDMGPPRPDGPVPPLPPEVLSFSPQQSSPDVPRDAAVVLTFSVSMDPTSVGQRVRGRATNLEGERPWPIQISGSGTEFLIRPALPWPAQAEVEVSLRAGAFSEAGVAMEAGASVRFRTEGILPLPASVGASGSLPLACPGAFQEPAALANPDGGWPSLGWTWSDLRAGPAWNVPVQSPLPWINENSLTLSSVRTDPRQVPDAGMCFLNELLDRGPAQVLKAQSAFHDPTVGFDELATAEIEPGRYPEDLRYPFTAAVWGLYSRPEDLSEPDLETIRSFEESLPPRWRAALAGWVLAAEEARLLRDVALADWSLGDQAAVRTGVTGLSYATTQSAFWLSEPISVLPVLARVGDQVDLPSLNRAGQRVLQAVELLQQVHDQEGPWSGPGLDLVTPRGRILIRPEDQDHGQVPSDLFLLLDVRGNDRYLAALAASTEDRPVSVAVDLAGDDQYGDPTPLRERSRGAALAEAEGFGLGFGLLGVGVLWDGGGDDVYRGSTYSQGAGFVGVGALVDRGGGHDRYEAAFFAQGAAQYGAGLLDDDGGDDRYVIGTTGQGMGRPRGQGLLLDRGGADDYLALYVADPPGLPDGSPLWFPSGYQDRSGNPHNLSVAQGVGWGLRPEWGTSGVAWSGGFGALVDLGEEADLHYADTMAMGQGFVYGMGLLYDGGGNDLYRALWWAMGSGTHMGTGLMIEAGGDDDLSVNVVSAALGHDLGVSWYIDLGGDDVYGGGLSLARAYDEGNAFFLELDGTDVYQSNYRQGFGACHFSQGMVLPTLPRMGLFLDLGGDVDVYMTQNEAAGNDGRWVQAPFGAVDGLGTKRGYGLDQ